MWIAILTLAAAFVLISLFLRQPKFGKLAEGDRLQRIQASPNYRNGEFQNLSHTPDLTEGVTYGAVLKEFFFTKRPNRIPTQLIPSGKTDLKNLSPDENVLVWFGHSSYFMQMDGKKILVDPVLSGAASPVRFTTRSFKGTDVYNVHELPAIDYLFITHDHWDHLDHSTVVALKDRVGSIITGLGTAAHLEHWGFPLNRIHEKDWNEEIDLGDGFTVHSTPARHFSGRGLKRKQSLWMSFVLKTPSHKVFIGGDSGYDSHFAEIGNQHGDFDLVILECGQYDKSWKYIHMAPEEVLVAAKELRAKRLLPVHSSKFALANHAWDEPLKKLTELNQVHQVNMITPMIGEKVNLKDPGKTYSDWWSGIF